jgi:heptosyltransferase III
MDGTARSKATLVLFPGALGDAVCLEPTVARLAAEGPVAVWARGAAREVAALFASRPDTESIDRREIASLFAPRRDVGIDPGDAFLSTFRRIRSFTGVSAPEMTERCERHPDARAIAFPARHGRVHASHLFLRGALGDAGLLAPFPRLLADGSRVPTGRPLLTMHPGSGGRGKRVSSEVLARVAQSWRERGGEVDVVLGPAERDERELWSSCGTVMLPESVCHLASILTGARAHVGLDSGPSHVAAALGISTTVLFVASKPESFGPRGPDVRWVDARHSRGTAALAAAAWDAVAPQLP